jgi:hypothetical protein
MEKARHPSRIDDKDQTHMTSDPQGDMISALENFRNAAENGTLNPKIVRLVAETINAVRTSDGGFGLSGPTAGRET